MSSEDPSQIDRRTFLKTTAAGGALITIGGMTIGCGNDVAPAPLAAVVVANDVSANSATLVNDGLSADYGVIRVPWMVFKDLAPIGGAITLQLPSEIQPSNDVGYIVPDHNTVLLVHTAQDTFIAVQSSCPHQGCPLGYAKGMIQCPCHASTFYADTATGHCIGEVAHRPAQSSLQRYKVSVVAHMVGTAGVLPFVEIDLKETVSCDCKPSVPAIVGGTVTFTFAEFPELATAGGSVCGQPAGATAPIVVVRLNATSVAALNARCTHKGCTVSWAPSAMELQCPCHGSTFAPDGRVLTAPATRPLPSYQATLNADSIVVTVV
jgi:Rieske Fe-S protein